MHHLWNGFVGVPGNIQQRDFFSLIDCIFWLGSATLDSHAAGVMSRATF